MKYTNTYQFPLPEAHDHPSAAGIRTQSQKMEEALASLRAELLAAAAVPEVITGTYTGDGASSQEIHLGFKPRAVLAEEPSGLRMSNGVIRGGLVVDGGASQVAAVKALDLTDDGFLACYDAGKAVMNLANATYYYLALRP